MINNAEPNLGGTPPWKNYIIQFLLCYPEV